MRGYNYKYKLSIKWILIKNKTKYKENMIPFLEVLSIEKGPTKVDNDS